MAKTNYDRVESAIEEGLLKMKTENLIEDSNAVSKIKKIPENLRSTREKLMELTESRKQERRLIAASLQYDVDRLFKKDKQFYSSIGTYHDEFCDLIKEADSMNESKWNRLMEIREKINAAKEKLDKDKKSETDESVIEAQRKKHKNKRFNVKEKWLPLY